ncbi:hypothetical protein ACROYT_G041665 [Oculina patagonica]
MGISLNFGVLFPVLMDYFQESRERTAWVGSVQIAFIFALGPLTSALVNRLGCRLTAIIGGLLSVSGLLLSSLASSIFIMYVTYSVLFGFGSSCLYVSSYVITSLYFDKNRSIATGITSSGSGLGVLSIAPILQALLDLFDWRKTYRITAGIFSIVCVLCLTFDPTVAKQRGERGVDGRDNEELEMSDEQDVEIIEDKRKKWFDFSVFKEKVFVVLTLCMTVASLGHNTPRLHLVRFSEDLQVSADAASQLFIYIGITTFIGRLLSGFLCNMRCVNPIYVLMFGYVLDGSASIFLSQLQTYGQLIVFSFLFGLADGLILGTFHITMLNSVGPSKRASAFGLSALFYGSTIATGPPLAGFMTDRLHTYIPSFILAAVTEYIAALLLLILLCGKKQSQNHEALVCGDQLEHRNFKEVCTWETNV